MKNLINRVSQVVTMKPSKKPFKVFVLTEVENSIYWEPWYDKACGFVIVAKDEEAARKIAADNCNDEGREAWLNKDHSNCEEVNATFQGIILKSEMWA